MQEPLSIERIRWKCRRGMLELDFLLKRFVDVRYEQLSTEDKQLFETLLTEQDPVLFSWLMGHESPLPEFDTLVRCIRNAGA